MWVVYDLPIKCDYSMRKPAGGDPTRNVISRWRNHRNVGHEPRTMTMCQKCLTKHFPPRPIVVFPSQHREGRKRHLADASDACHKTVAEFETKLSLIYRSHPFLDLSLPGRRQITTWT